MPSAHLPSAHQVPTLLLISHPKHTAEHLSLSHDIFFLISSLCVYFCVSRSPLSLFRSFTSPHVLDIILSPLYSLTNIGRALLSLSYASAIIAML